MKKLALSVIVAGMFAFVACGPKGPSEEEQQRIKDSLLQDSLMKDSIAQAEAAVKLADSLKADSIAKAAATPEKKK